MTTTARQLLGENRASNTSEVLDKAAKAIGTRVSAWFTADGSIALVRTPDGNAYEVEVRPASLRRFSGFNKLTTGSPRRRLARQAMLRRRWGDSPLATE